jgi:hypothetical protein
VDIGAIDDLEAIAAQVPYDTACIVMPSAAADVCASKLTPFHPADSHVSRKAI